MRLPHSPRFPVSEPHCLRLQNDLAPACTVKRDARRCVGLNVCSQWLLQT